MTTRHSAFFRLLSDNERHGTPWASLVRYSSMNDVFDVVADQTRREIVELLRTAQTTSTELSVGQLVESLGLTQPTVSKHLKVLRESGLVAVREEGQHRYYRLDPSGLRPVHAWLASVSDQPDPSTAEPFVDLEYLGRATGSLVHDGVEALNRALGSFRK